MTSGLDHIAIAVNDLEPAQSLYTSLLGVEPDREDGGGAKRAWFRFHNMALELMAPDGEGGGGVRVRAQLSAHGEGMWSLAFTTSNLETCGKHLARLGLRNALLASPAQALGLDPADTGGLQIFMKPESQVRTSLVASDGAATGLDHVVVHTASPDRALAIYGAKLGLELRLDRSNADWGVRQLFFKAGEAVVEFGASLKSPATDDPDRFGGMAWRVADAEIARARIAAAGFDVSEVRQGRKPGTKVFTVRGGVPAAPALFVEQGHVAPPEA